MFVVLFFGRYFLKTSFFFLIFASYTYFFCGVSFQNHVDFPVSIVECFSFLQNQRSNSLKPQKIIFFETKGKMIEALDPLI